MTDNDTVKFANETQEETAARTTGKITMSIVWIDGPRAMVKTRLHNFTMPIFSVYAISDLEVIPTNPNEGKF